MNYDTMTFKELVQETISHSFDGTPPPDDWLDMMRSAVIREASVGVVTTYTTLDGPEENEHMRTDWHIEGNYPEDGTFDLIPHKEKP